MNLPAINRTHDPLRRSWISSANVSGTDFPIQNLPFGVFRRRGTADAPRCGVGIGDCILDVAACAGLLQEAHAAAMACGAPHLNALMTLEPQAVSALRAALSDLLQAGQERHRGALAQALVPLSDAELLLPVRIGGFTDFFASIHHASNAGRLFRPDAPLLPNYKYVPVAYNGRANSVRASGTPVRRPRGQIRPQPDAAPVYAPSRRMDYEVELGMYIGQPTSPEQPAAIADAWRHIFGFSLLNDWSARDIQSWEYQPLGPFLGKSFATSVSPWVVTAEALAPFRTAPAARAEGDPSPMPHLYAAEDQRTGALQISVEAWLRTATMTERGLPAVRLSRSGAESLYWTFAQMVAHHTSNGCALDTGDLLGSGTISGSQPGALGSLLEITAGGAQPMTLAQSDEHRAFLEDGDEIILRGRCERAGWTPIGFGECAARLLPAAPMDLPLPA